MYGEHLLNSYESMLNIVFLFQSEREIALATHQLNTVPLQQHLVRLFASEH